MIMGMRGTTKWMMAALVASVLLCIFHASLYLTWGLRDHMSELVLYLGDVMSPLGWHSCLTILVTGMLGFSCMRLAAAKQDYVWAWVGGFFLLLALDDLFEVHEAIGVWLWPMFSGSNVYGWVMVIGPLLAIAGVAIFVHFMRSCSDRSQRWKAFGGFACMGLALCLELLEGFLMNSDAQWRGISLDRYTHVPEEFLEFLGVWLLLFCVLRELHELKAAAVAGPGGAGGD